MKALVTIPHYFNAGGDGKYVSTSANPQPRLEACRACLNALHRLFGRPQYQMDIQRWSVVPVNPGAILELDIVLCTTKGHHLVNQLGLPSDAYRHVPMDVEPMMLEFECQRVLRDALGRYDYYCFLEDDLVIHDPWFFRKLQWFNQTFGNESLLQPNRFENGELAQAVSKLYIDGNLPASSTAPHQNVREHSELAASFLSSQILFIRPINPHAACYFLTEAQMTHWANQAHFLDRDVAWCGPLESAATLGIMKTFRLYKPAPACLDFFELEHRSSYNLSLVGKDLQLLSSRTGFLGALSRALSPLKPLPK